MATTLREFELLIPRLASQSTLPASRPLHRAAALEIFHLITGRFLIIYASHIPFRSHCVSHSIPTSFLSDFLFHFFTNFGAQLYSILSPYRYIEIAVILSTALMGGMVVVISSSRRGSRCSIPRRNQYMTQYFHSFTISSASIFSSASST